MNNVFVQLIGAVFLREPEGILGAVSGQIPKEFQRPAELRQRVGILREEHGVIVDVDLQWSPVAQESGGEEIEVGQEEFSTIEFGPDEHAAAIVEHIEHGNVQRALGEPAMGRSAQLPEFADLGALPAAHRGVRALGRSVMRMIILDGQRRTWARSSLDLLCNS